jgi:two-component system, NtrC family, nitrogen regulation response regulator NtrX
MPCFNYCENTGNLLGLAEKEKKVIMSYKLLCIDDDPKFLLGIKAVLKKKYTVVTALDWQTGEKELKAENFDIVFLDIGLANQDGIEILKKIKKSYPSSQVLMLTGERDPETIVNAMRFGAADYLCKPLSATEMAVVVEKHLKNKDICDRYDALIENMSQETSSERSFIGKSACFAEIMERADKLVGYDANVLIQGESGTGKELLARHIHQLENDSSRPFITVNCAAIPENLVESELFGHEQGSFTGAIKRKIGKFELASDGDIFLDEINSLKPELQAKLLRILQEKEFYRVGGNQPIKANFRVIAASNANLHELVQSGSFRQDLLYRLHVVALTMPPLRERFEDLPILLEHFMKKHSKFGTQKTVSKLVVDAFKSYNWPGNIRELENLIQSLIIMSQENEITVQDLPEWLKKDETIVEKYDTMPELRYDSIADSLKDFLGKVEREYMSYVIKNKNGNISEAARSLGVSRSKVYYTLKC